MCVCMCDETELMTERFFPVLAVGFLRDCKFVMFCGDTVIVRRFVCTVANNANWFRNMYLYVFIYVHYICLCVCTHIHYTYIYIHTCVCVCMCVCVCV